jgi:hypothetical protein
MTRRLSFIFAGFLSAFATASMAQPVVVLGDDDDVVIREFVPPEPPTTEYRQTLIPGSVIPPDVPLKLFPATAPPKLRGYAYFVSVDQKLVVVEADTRRVVRILKTN